MKNIVLFGPPGAGKGTQSEKIIDKYDLVHLSTGDILRSEIKNNTELGMMAKSYIDKGNLVPDEVVIGMIGNKIMDHKSAKGFIFDGFPRTIAQAEALDKLMGENGIKISRMIALEVEEEELIQRILERGKGSGRADDQNEETIRNRISVYNSETSPVAGFYESQSKFKSILGVGAVDEIFGSICTEIDAL